MRTIMPNRALEAARILNSSSVRSSIRAISTTPKAAAIGGIMAWSR